MSSPSAPTGPDGRPLGIPAVGEDAELRALIAASPELSRLIAAASVSGTEHELAGEGLAVAAFRSHRLGTADPAAEPTPSAAQTPSAGAANRRVRSAGRLGGRTKQRSGRAGRVLVATGAAGVVLAGVGVAAATGGLPAPLQGAAHRIFDAPAKSSAGAGTPLGRRSASPTAPGASATGSSNSASSTTTGSPTGSTSNSTPAPRSAPPSTGSSLSPSATGTAAAALTGQCRTYLSSQARQALLSTPDYAPLVTAAGGTSKVQSFCVKLAGTPSASSSATPSPSGSEPTSRSESSSRAGTTHPTAKPAHPTAKPAHPTAKPAKPVKAGQASEAGWPPAGCRHGDHSGRAN